MNTLQISIFYPLHIEEFVFTPESDLRDPGIEPIDAESEVIIGVSVVDFQHHVIDRYFPIGIDGSVDSEAEDILWGLEGWFHTELTEQRFFLIESSLESEIGNLLDRTMDLLVVVSSEFPIEDSLGYRSPAPETIKPLPIGIAV